MSKVTILGREQILSAQDLEKELVEVKEWGGAVYVRALTGIERDAFEASMVDQRGKSRTINLKNLRARLCALTICDEEGNRLFSDADVEELGKKSAAALTRVFEVAQRLSGLSQEDVEELGKPSEDGPNEGSTSG